MTVKEATRHLLKQLETVGWTVSRGRYPMARYGGRVLRFRPRSIATSNGMLLPSAKYYASCMHRLLLEWPPL